MKRNRIDLSKLSLHLPQKGAWIKGTVKKRVSANYHNKVDWLNIFTILLVIPFLYKSFMRVQNTNTGILEQIKVRYSRAGTSKAKEVYLESYFTES